MGDWVLTRRNQRLATILGGRDFVKNGDRWTLQHLHPDGSATLEHHRHRGRVRLPAKYLAGDLELGYAATAHRAQGATVDTAHVLVTDTDTRQALYVAASRARMTTTLYAITEHDDTELPDPALHDGGQVLEQVIRRDADSPSVETIRLTQQSGCVDRATADVAHLRTRRQIS